MQLIYTIGMDISSPDKTIAITQSKRSINYGMILLGGCWLLFGTFLMYQHPSIFPPIIIRWETESEFDTAGFNIYRSETVDGDYVMINQSLIPSRGEASIGTSYEFIDRNVSLGVTYFYVLEDIEYSNQRTQHPPLAHQTNWSSAISTHALTFLSIAIGLWLCLQQLIWRR